MKGKVPEVPLSQGPLYLPVVMGKWSQITNREELLWTGGADSSKRKQIHGELAVTTVETKQGHT